MCPDLLAWKQTPEAMQKMTNRSPGPGPSFEASGCGGVVLLRVQSELVLSVRRILIALLIIRQECLY